MLCLLQGEESFTFTLKKLDLNKQLYSGSFTQVYSGFPTGWTKPWEFQFHERCFLIPGKKTHPFPTRICSDPSFVLGGFGS